MKPYPPAPRPHFVLPLWLGPATRARTIRHAHNIASRWRTTCVLLSTGPRQMASANFTGALNPAMRWRIGVGTGRLAPGRRPRACTLLRAFSVPTAVCIWSFASNERGQKLTSATPEPAEIAQAPRSSPRAVGDQHEVRTSRQAPRRNGAGSGSRWVIASWRPNPLLIRAAEHSSR